MLRVYIAGEILIEADSRLVREADLPARQARIVFAYLVHERRRSVSRNELCEVLWNDEPPPASDIALSAVLSKLRACFERARLEPRLVLQKTPSGYQLQLPPDAWVDVEYAMKALHEAESALLHGAPERAYLPAVAATAILRRPYLDGIFGERIERQRAALDAALLRVLDVMVECLMWNGEYALARNSAEEAVERAPFREESYRRLMRLHAATGNRAEAIRVYHRCRELLANELGVDPSPETEAAYLAYLSPLA